MDILKNKYYNSYDRLSRYNNVPCYYNSVDDKYQTSTVSNLDDATKYLLYVSVKGDTYDGIALHYYNNPTYYWVICDFNRIIDPFTPPKEGSSIKIPVLSSLSFLD